MKIIFCDHILKNLLELYVLYSITCNNMLYTFVIVFVFAVTLKNSSVKLLEDWEESTGKSDMLGTTMTHLLPRSSKVVQKTTSAFLVNKLSTLYIPVSFK